MSRATQDETVARQAREQIEYNKARQTERDDIAKFAMWLTRQTMAAEIIKPGWWIVDEWELFSPRYMDNVSGEWEVWGGSEPAKISGHPDLWSALRAIGYLHIDNAVDGFRG